MICDTFRLSNYALARSGGEQNWRPENRQLRIHFSTRIIKLVQSTSTRRWSRLSFEQRTAHMQHRYLVILLMALESYGVELSSYFRRASNRRIHSRTTRWIELYNMQSKSKGLHLFTHMIKLVQSTMAPLKFSNEGLQHALKSLKRSTCIEKSQSSYRIELNKENHLFYGIESWDRQETCSEKKVHAHATWPFKDGKKKIPKGSSIFSLKNSSNKIFIAIIRISSNERQRNCW